MNKEAILNRIPELVDNNYYSRGNANQAIRNLDTFTDNELASVDLDPFFEILPFEVGSKAFTPKLVDVADWNGFIEYYFEEHLNSSIETIITIKKDTRSIKGTQTSHYFDERELNDKQLMEYLTLIAISNANKN